MRVIPVLDLKAGRAVWARRGLRDAYKPVQSVLVPEAGDAIALARAFRHDLGCDECYVADLDAIAGAAPQYGLLRSLSAVGACLLADTGGIALSRGRDTLAAGAARVVVGLETLPSFGALEALTQALGPEQVVFSLDLRDGKTLVPPESPIRGSPLALVADAVRCGVAAVAVIDLARVGTGMGLDLELISTIRRAYPTLELLAGGGIASARDIDLVAAAGCDGVLVATALHDGTLDGGCVDAIRRPGLGRRASHTNDSR